MRQYTLIDELDEEDVDTYIAEHSLSHIFRDRRYALQDFLESANHNFFPWTEIERLVGLPQEIIRKKIQLSRPMTRDCLIAICAAHGMDDLLTSKVLNKCGMPGLDNEFPHDAAIIDALLSRPTKNGCTEPLSVAKINELLTDRGLSELWIKERTVPQKKKEKQVLPYPILREYTQTYRDDGDPYDSLGTAYDFRYMCHAVTLLDVGNSKQIKLTMRPNGHCQIIDERERSDNHVRFIHSEVEAGELSPYYIRLITKARKRQNELIALVNDTKNYKERISARLQNDRIHVFYEEYNYNSPELNEYFLMQYSNGKYQLTIAHHSMFMQHYLSPEDYHKHYGAPNEKITACYDSEEEIISLLNTDPPYYLKTILSRRLKVFRRLRSRVSLCLEQLRNRETFVHNIKTIWENPAEVLRYYGVERAYGVIRDEEHDEIISATETAELQDEGGNSMTVSFADLTRAFELGFESVQQVCRVLMSLGTVDAVLE